MFDSMQPIKIGENVIFDEETQKSIYNIADYALSIPEKPRTLETFESLTQRRFSKLTIDPGDALELEAPKIISTEKRKSRAFSSVEKTIISPPQKKSNLPIVFQRSGTIPEDSTSNDDFCEQLLVAKKVTQESHDDDEVKDKRPKKMFDSILDILKAKSDKSVSRKDIVKNIIKVVKYGNNTHPKDMMLNGFERETWIRLSGERKAKKAITDYNQKVLKRDVGEREKKGAEDSHSDGIVISRLLISLSHNHPSEVNKMFVEMDRKSRLGRVRLELSEFVRILSKPSSTRSSAELQGVDDYLRLLPEFQTKPDYIIAHLCFSLFISQFNQGDSIFRQGDPGNKWFVILTGSVKITVTKPGWSFLDPKSPQNYIATLKAGEKFGDHALLNDLNRSASSWADSQPTILLTLEKFEFLRLIGQAHQIEQKNRLLLLKKIPMLSKLDSPSLRNVADRLVIRTIPPNTILQNEGEMTDTVFFIKSGNCAVFRNVIISTDSESGAFTKKTLLLGHLGSFGSFNEGCAFSNRAASRKGAPYTVVTIDSVIIATIACSGEWLNFNLTRVSSVFEDLSNDELAHRYKLSCQAKTFRSYQRRYVRALQKEKQNL